MKSIQSKILFVVITGLVVITAVVSAIGVTMTHEVMHRDADRILKNAAQREAAEINDMLGDVVKSCGIMEHYAIAEAGNDPEKLKDDTFRNQYLERAEIMFAEVVVNTEGVEAFYLRLDPAWADGTSGFYNRVTADGGLESMPLTDLTKYDRNDEQNVGWYYRAVKAGRGVWMDPYYFPGDENRMISFVEPLYAGRELIGVIGFDMSFDYLVQRVKEIAVYEDGYAVLLARDGVTAYNTTEEGEHGHEHSDPGTATRVELKNGMFLKLQADYKDIQRDIRPILGKIVAAFVIVLVCAIAYTVFVTRRIVGPLKRLTAAAESIATGNEQTGVMGFTTESKDEIGTLAQVLGNAYAKIQEYTAYINALAYRDSLTGIKNTTAYAEATKDLNKEICTGNPRFGVLVADINNLKRTNDQFGHDVGNELIVHTTKLLTSVFKNSVVFRIGGDEFAVLLQGEDYRQYRTCLKQLDEMCAAACITVGESTIPVSVARGVSLFDPSIDRVYEDVFAKADHEMYVHKEQMKAAAQ